MEYLEKLVNNVHVKSNPLIFAGKAGLSYHNL